MRKFEYVSDNELRSAFSFFPDSRSRQLEKIKNYIKLPERGTPQSAGYDFYLPMDVSLKPGEAKKIPTGIKAYMKDDEVLQIYPRSGLGFVYHLRVSNTVGIIDADYADNAKNEGHIFIKIRNEGEKVLELEAGSRFAQGIFTKYLTVKNDSTINDSREGGLSSTGTK